MKTILICLLTMLVATSTIAAEGKDPFAWEWYEVDAKNQVHINMFVFYRSTCPRCKEGLRFAEGLKARYSWLQWWKYDITAHAGNLELYRRMAASLRRPAGNVPAFFYCKQLTLGYISYQQTGNRIEANLVHWHDQLQKQLDERNSSSSLSFPAANHAFATLGFDQTPLIARLNSMSLLGMLSNEPLSASVDMPSDAEAHSEIVTPDEQFQLELPLELPEPPEQQEEKIQVPFIGEQRASDLSLPAFTLIIAGCDAFNPCAFFILLSLLSLLIHARSRGRMLLVGGIFVLCSGLFYFVFMAAWLNVFMLAGHLNYITVGAGLLAVAVALINIKDYFALKKGLSLSIPESAKPGLFERMRKLVGAASLWPMLLGTLGLAIAANAYELLCTAGFPMVFTRVLTLRELPTTTYYTYLVLYNVVYVVPLAAIVFVFTFTLGTRKLQEHEGRFLKLLSGTMMLLLGTVILFAPSLLHSLFTAVALLAGAVGLTMLIVLADRWLGITHHQATHPNSHAQVNH